VTPLLVLRSIDLSTSVMFKVPSFLASVDSMNPGSFLISSSVLSVRKLTPMAEVLLLLIIIDTLPVSPLILLASCISFGMMVTLLVWMAQGSFFEKTNHLSFGGFLEGKDGGRLQSKVGLEVGSDFSYESLERKLSNE
jgi:hypothetical protein